HLGLSFLRVQNRLPSIGKASLTISAKPIGVGAAYQRLIPTGERSGLLTRTAATESVSLCADENPTELRFDHTLICRERAGSHGKAYASYRGVAFNDCFLRNSHARALIEFARA